MRTLTLHTADELVERWRRRAVAAAENAIDSAAKGWDFTAGYGEGMAQGYRVAAAELLAILAASMELEAAHHGDPE